MRKSARRGSSTFSGGFTGSLLNGLLFSTRSANDQESIIAQGRAGFYADGLTNRKGIDMRKVIFAAALATLVFGPAALAHPTGVRYETRGECEAAFAEASKDDRDRLVELGVFDTRGQAQRTFNEIFACEYDETEDAWFIVFVTD